MNFDDLIKIAPVAGQEQDFRTKILNTLIATPHKDVTPFLPLFRHVHDKDPLFFVRLGLWYIHNGTVRDLKQLFIAMLCTSSFSEDFREAGLCLLMQLPPHQVDSVLDMVKGHKDRKTKTWVKGLVKNVPRSFKSAIEDYLRDREAKPEWFNAVVLRNRGDLKRLYSTLRIKPGANAQKVLFNREAIEGSSSATVKQIANSKDPAEQARLIVENKIPYAIAVGLIDTMSPAVVTALISVMSPQELINSMASLNERGALNNPDIKALVSSKLESATTAKGSQNVSALKTRVAVGKAGLDAEMTKKVKDVGDAKIKGMGSITKPTALLIDKSGSMNVAIEIGKQIAAMIAPICVGDLFVYAFDAVPYELVVKNKRKEDLQLSDWEHMFKGLAAGGNTFAGVPIYAMSKRNQRVEQIIYVTDEGENGTPKSGVAIAAYAKQFDITDLNVVIVRVGNSSDQMERSIKHAGFNVEIFTPSSDKSDYYSLPSLLPMLAKGSRLDLLMDIMDMDLPVRQKRIVKQAAMV